MLNIDRQIRRIIFMLCLILYCNFIDAKTKDQPRTVIEFTTSDKNVNSDSIVVTFGIAENPFSNQLRSYEIGGLKSGELKPLELNFINKPTEVTIRGSHIPFTKFYIRPNDSITVKFDLGSNNKSIVSISGQGANYINEALKATKKSDSLTKLIFPPGPDPIGQFESLAKTLNYLNCETALLVGLLDKSETTECKPLYDLTRSDIVGDRAYSFSIYIKRALALSDSSEGIRICNLLKQSEYDSRQNLIEGAINFRLLFGLFLFEKARNLVFNKYSSNKEDLFEQIIHTYDNSLRSKLLVYAFTNESLDNTSAQFSNISNRITKYILKEDLPFFNLYIEKNTKGAELPSFVFEDVKGNKVTLSAYKGKLLLIDVWFTGCGACAYLTKRLEKEVIPNLNDIKIEYISICLDKKKELWLSSVEKGLYTNNESVNLLTLEEGFDHPFVKYFNISGGPTLMLIDENGNLITSKMPHMDSKEIVRIIKNIEGR